MRPLGIYAAILIHLRRMARGKISTARLRKIAEQTLKQLEEHGDLQGWERAAHATVEQARRESHLYRTVQLFGQIVELKDVQRVTVDQAVDEDEGDDPETDDLDESEGDGGQVDDDDDGYDSELDEVDEDDEVGEDGDADSDVIPIKEEATCVRLRDMSGSEIWSLEVLGADLIDKLQRIRRTGLPAEFLGMVITLPAMLDKKRLDASFGRDREDFVLHLLDARPSRSVLNMLGATSDERQGIEACRAELLTLNTSPLEDLRAEIIHGLAISGTDDFRLLRDLIEFTVLQALSTGRINQASGRLHALVVGPPGQGKKLIGVSAKVLNPVCAELSSVKVTPAGLVGSSTYTNGGWVSKPGLLPNAAYGVAWMQDAHGIGDTDVRRIAPILQEVIEDGVVRNAVAGGVLRDAPVALLIDANRTSHLMVGSGARAEAPILRVRPLLSRIDVIAEIPDDVDRTWTVAGKMYRAFSVLEEGSNIEPQWIRGCRLLVATLRDRHPIIELDGVRSMMESVHDELRRNNQETFTLLPEAGDIPTRLAISFARLVTASARAHDRSVATEDDVDLAVRFLNLKLAYLRLRVAKSVSACPDVQMGRQAWVAQHAGMVVTATALAEKYTVETGMAVSDRTIRRDLAAIGAQRVSKDEWLVPDIRTSGHDVQMSIDGPKLDEG